ncbi:MAG: hypothetical protein HQL51_14240 [Magnetococcales bacterium]|nr:hypothetical protein [Magnetococcales bacterium]
MELYFNNRIRHLPELYEGEEDVPSLAISVHLHAWRFPEGADPQSTPPREARLRLEIREGSTQSDHPLVGVGFVTVSPEAVLAWQGLAPLSQAILDGLFTHPRLHELLTSAAREALKLPEELEAEKEAAIKIPLNVVKKRMEKGIF